MAFRETPRRAWGLGTGRDAWDIVELLRSYATTRSGYMPRTLTASAHLRLARAHGERFPNEIAAFAEDSRLPLHELRRLYPFLQTGA